MLAIMGAVFSGVGLVLLVGANWQDIPVSARIGMIIAAIIATNGIGYYLRYRRGYVRAGEAILLLGCFFKILIWGLTDDRARPGR